MADDPIELSDLLLQIPLDNTSTEFFGLNSQGQVRKTTIFREQFNGVKNEVENARQGEPDLNARLEKVVTAIGGVQLDTQALKNAAQPRPIIQEFRAQTRYIPLQKNFTITIPTILKSEYGGDLTIPSQTVTLDVPASATVTETKVLRSPPRLGDGRIDTSNFPGDRLLYRYVTNVVVRRKSDNAVLVRGTDYEIKPNTGAIYSMIQVPDFQVDVTYTGWMSRYDVIYGPFGTNGAGALGVGVLKGTNRIIDPSMYKPAIPAGILQIYHVYVYVAPDGTPRVDLLPVYRYRGRDRIDQPGRYTDHLERNRRCLAPVLARLRQGIPVNVVAYGDSILAQGGGMGANQLVPNVDRDVLSGPAGYYITDGEPLMLGRMPADTAATIPRYDGPLGAGKHVHLSPVWYMLEAIKKAYGVNCPYLNMAVPGSDSSNSVNNGIRNGLDPTRLAALLTYAKDALLVLHFGMNELGQPGTRQNLVAIASAWKQNGGLGAIIMTPPQINYAGGRAPATQWLDTHNQCVAAATDELIDCAFIETARIDGQYPYIPTKVFPEIDVDPAYVPGLDYEQWHHGCSGLSWMDLCDINLFNHPGPEQLKQYGFALADIFQANEALSIPTNLPASANTVNSPAGSYSIVEQENVIKKGGPIPATGDADLVVSFPVPFPNECFEVVPILEPGAIPGSVTYTATILNRTKTGFTVQRRGIGSGGPGPAVVAGRYIATGR